MTVDVQRPTWATAAAARPPAPAVTRLRRGWKLRIAPLEVRAGGIGLRPVGEAGAPLGTGCRADWARVVGLTARGRAEGLRGPRSRDQTQCPGPMFDGGRAAGAADGAVAERRGASARRATPRRHAPVSASSARRATSRPIGSEAVAAGEGAFSTWTTAGPRRRTGSRPPACRPAAPPAPVPRPARGTRSSARSAGSSRRTASVNARLRHRAPQLADLRTASAGGPSARCRARPAVAASSRGPYDAPRRSPRGRAPAPRWARRARRRRCPGEMHAEERERRVGHRVHQPAHQVAPPAPARSTRPRNGTIRMPGLVPGQPGDLVAVQARAVDQHPRPQHRPRARCARRPRASGRRSMRATCAP